MDTQLPLSDETRIRREAHRQSVQRADLYAVLDEALVAHVATVVDGLPRVLPFACARDGDWLLLHGSTAAGQLRAGSGVAVCVEVTHLDGLVFARSAFESSMRFRSAVIHGVAEPVSGEDKARCLDVLTDHLLAGRTAEVRPSTRKELAATLLLRVELARASVKLSSDGPVADPEDPEPKDVWAGIVPLKLTASAPVSLADVPEGVEVAPSALRMQQRVNTPAPRTPR